MSKFTKQHYKAIAEMVIQSHTKDELINMLIGYFKADNPKFNEKKFRAYIDYLKAKHFE